MLSPLNVAGCEAAVWRILDANANRAAEGLRVVEEYLRFVRNDAWLTAACKQLRHDLGVTLQELAPPSRWLMRDVTQDVGRTLQTPQEYRRATSADVAAANLNRVLQALRCLEEFGKLLSRAFAEQIEHLRYEVYDLERAVHLSAHRPAALETVQLCVLVDGTPSAADFANRVEQLLAAGVGAIQLRDKRLSDRQLAERARTLRELTGPCHALGIANDRADLAASCGLDGVHLGQEDLMPADARRVLGPHAIIGVSTHSLDQAQQAVRDGADYIGVGPTFPSSTKHFEHYPGPELLREVAGKIRVPAFAIGGITLDRLPEVLSTGIRRVAVASAIWNATKVAEAAREFLRRLAEIGPKVLATIVAAMILRIGGITAATAAEPQYGPARLLCEIKIRKLAESSGLAISRLHPGLIWSHNDSGDEPRLYAFDLDGEHRGTCKVRGATAVDWEDMASVQIDGQSYLVVADIGDNGQSRSSYWIYLIPEPVSPKDDAQVAHAVQFTYEDGPHDAEAIAVDPVRREILIAQKRLFVASHVYRLAWPEPASGERQVARRVCTVPVPWVTGMDISPDGRRAVLITYGNGFDFPRALDESWDQALTRPGRLIELPFRHQGEAVCYGPDGVTLYLTSEKRPCPLFAVSPQTVLQVP